MTSKTVASVSFRDDRSLSVDIEDVRAIELGAPIQVAEDGQWFCELIVRGGDGFVALQLLADDPSRFKVMEADVALEQALDETRGPDEEEG